MVEDIRSRYDEIYNDILINQGDVFNLRETYCRKYSKYSDRINDVNVGLFLNDRQQPTVQIFVRNKTGYIRSHLIFNKEGSEIKDINVLNYKINE
jgi:hypothetical protein